jgi:hypothetical protein
MGLLHGNREAGTDKDIGTDAPSRMEIKFKHKLAVAAIMIAGGGMAGTLASCDSATSRDAAATSAYMSARRVLERASASTLPAGSASVKEFVAHVRQGCPGALKDAPAEPSVVKQSNGELAVNGQSLLAVAIANDLEVVLDAPRTQARKQFINVLKGLQWEDRDVTGLVRALAATEANSLAVRARDICDDARAWAAGGYKHLPVGIGQDTTALEVAKATLSRRLSAVGCDAQYPQLAVPQVLERYQGRSERIASERVGRQERQRVAAEGAIVSKAVAVVQSDLGEPAGQRGLAMVQRGQATVPTHLCGSAEASKATLPSVPMPNVPSHRVEGG